jgi:hypothetical protein
MDRLFPLYTYCHCVFLCDPVLHAGPFEEGLVGIKKLLLLAIALRPHKGSLIQLYRNDAGFASRKYRSGTPFSLAGVMFISSFCS